MRKNLDPNYWGPSAWLFLETCLEGAEHDTKAKKAQIELYRLLPDLLPCERCREHTKEYLYHNPPSLKSDLRDWLSTFKETIRQRKMMEHMEENLQEFYQKQQELQNNYSRCNFESQSSCFQNNKHRKYNNLSMASILTISTLIFLFLFLNHSSS